MKRIGITGQNGFIGSHLYNTLKLYPNEFDLIEFKRDFFEDDSVLDYFVKQCDVIIHLAALNRHNEAGIIYNTNTSLVKKLINSLERTNSTPHILFSSSSQEERDNLYGKSKRDSRILLSDWSAKSGGKFSGLIIPNVFGPFGKPFYNSVIATFCYQVSRDLLPKIDVDNQLKLIYIGELVYDIIRLIRNEDNSHYYIVNHTAEATVSELLKRIINYRDIYQLNGEIPKLNNSFDLHLFNTFRSYIDLNEYFPKKYEEHKDKRGAFVEIIRNNIGGQTSYSTTNPGITRGNHFHTRKIERFAVIKGKALIQLRRVGTDQVFNYYLDGNEPSYVDMPIWYTHNIKNIGEDVLYTLFWINEPYNADDPDTWMENV